MKLNPKDMERVMRQMGIKNEPVDAKEVVIKCANKEIVIKNPDVQKISMGGQESFQITGSIQERTAGPSEEDVKMVIEQTGADEKTARKALENAKGDIAQAILELTNE